MFKPFYLPSSYLFPYRIYLHIRPTSRVTKVNHKLTQSRFIHNWLGMYPISFALNSTHGNLENTLRAWSGTSGNLVGTQWEQVQYTKIQNQQSQHKGLPTSVVINNTNTQRITSSLVVISWRRAAALHQSSVKCNAYKGNDLFTLKWSLVQFYRHPGLCLCVLLCFNNWKTASSLCKSCMCVNVN